MFVLSSMFKNVEPSAFSVPVINKLLFESKLQDDVFYFAGPNAQFATSQSLPGGAISTFTDYNGTVAGTTKATTSSAHGLETGEIVKLVSSPDSYYNGNFTITKIDEDDFYFTKAYSAEDSGTFLLETPRLVGSLVAEFGGGTYDGQFTWYSKEFTMGQDTVDKKFIKLKIEASQPLITNPKVYVDGLEATLTSSGTNEWKIKKNDSTGASKKGKKIQVKIGDGTPVNPNIRINSIGIIYRSGKPK